jgi:AcrR family transcriptional regulator
VLTQLFLIIELKNILCIGTDCHRVVTGQPLFCISEGGITKNLFCRIINVVKFANSVNKNDMGITERRLREKEKVRTAILTTAWQMVKEEGWLSLSIRRIADAIEYSVPVIYDHFENKEAILLEFANEGFRLLTKKIQQAYEKKIGPADQLKAMADAYWNFALRNKAHYQLMYGVGMASCEGCNCLDDKEGFDYFIMEAIREIIAGSKQPGANVCLKYHTFWSILHGLVSIKIMGSSPVSGELNKMVLDDAINGFIKNLL